MSLSDGPGLLASGGEAPHLPVLVDGVDDPVDTGIVPDHLVRRIHEDDLVVFVGGVLKERKEKIKILNKKFNIFPKNLPG